MIIKPEGNMSQGSHGKVWEVLPFMLFQLTLFALFSIPYGIVKIASARLAVAIGYVAVRVIS